MHAISKNIITNKHFSFSGRLKKLLRYYYRKRWAEKSWNNRHREVFKSNGNFTSACDKKVELDHQIMWSSFRRKVDLCTLQLCKSISGNADPRMVPEDIFVSDIEPSLMIDDSAHFQSHKSFYNRWFSGQLFPQNYLHCISGQYLDQQMNPIGYQEFQDYAADLEFPVVLKPNKDSYGGKNVSFVNSYDELLKECKHLSDFIVQEKLVQHEFFKKYNPLGPNTLRVYVYKSVQDDLPHVLNIALRMGIGGSLDNETSGGIHTLIDEDGYMNNYAVDKDGTRFNMHPDTNKKFDQRIPAFEKLKEIGLHVGRQIYLTRIVGLDMFYDANGNWKIIEVNTKGHTIRFSQYGGKPFFGEFTEEVIDYCRKNHWALR